MVEPTELIARVRMEAEADSYAEWGETTVLALCDAVERLQGERDALKVENERLKNRYEPKNVKR